MALRGAAGRLAALLVVQWAVGAIAAAEASGVHFPTGRPGRRYLLGGGGSKEGEGSKRSGNEGAVSGASQTCVPLVDYTYAVQGNYICKDPDLRVLQGVSLPACETRCSCLDACIGYTWDPLHQDCYLKSDCTNGEVHDHSVSGFKQLQASQPGLRHSQQGPDPGQAGCDSDGTPLNQDKYGLGYCACEGGAVGETVGVAACRRLSTHCASLEPLSTDAFLDALQMVCDQLAQDSCRRAAQSTALALPGCRAVLQRGDETCSPDHARRFFAQEVDRMCAPFSP